MNMSRCIGRSWPERFDFASPVWVSAGSLGSSRWAGKLLSVYGITNLVRPVRVASFPIAIGLEVEVDRFPIGIER